MNRHIDLVNFVLLRINTTILETGALKMGDSVIFGILNGMCHDPLPLIQIYVHQLPKTPLQNRTEHSFYWSEIHIQRIVTKTTQNIQNKETVNYNQTAYIHV